MKKRNKKYNPNKLAQKYVADAHKMHTLEMTFNIESSNDQAISDCSLSNLCQNDTQNSLLIKQENQDMGDDSHIENHISKNCKVIEHEAE